MKCTKIIFVVVLLIVAFACRKKPSDQYEYYKPYQKDSVASQTVAPQITDSVKEATVVETEVQIKPVDLNHRFFIVLASYSVEDFARAAKTDLEKQGYQPAIFMVNDDGWHKLAIESYNNFDEAQKALLQIRKKEGMFANAVIVQK